MLRNTLFVLIAASMSFAACKKEKKPPKPESLYIEKSATIGYWQLSNQTITDGPVGMSYGDIIQFKDDNTYGVYRNKILIGAGTFSLNNEEMVTVIRFSAPGNENFGLNINASFMSWSPVYPFGAFIYAFQKKNGL